jgi:hypothetical protein
MGAEGYLYVNKQSDTGAATNQAECAQFPLINLPPSQNREQSAKQCIRKRRLGCIVFKNGGAPIQSQDCGSNDADQDSQHFGLSIPPTGNDFFVPDQQHQDMQVLSCEKKISKYELHFYPILSTNGFFLSTLITKMHGKMTFKENKVTPKKLSRLTRKAMQR